MTTREISNADDVIDSRDVIARIEELQNEKDNFQDENELPNSDLLDMTEEQNIQWMEWDESDEGQELKALIDLQNDANGSPDWEYGETLIRDSYFEDYAQELAEDIGAINKDATWPNDCIDWKKAASELQYDYMQVNFDGVDYWIRA
jgi:hypothetical protein